MMAFFCSTVQKFHWLFCVGNLGIRHWVNFKTESVLLKARRKNIKFYISLRNEWEQLQSDSWLSVFQDPKRNEAIIWITHKLVQDNESLSFRVFYSDGGTSEIDRFLECLTRVCMTSILWVFKLSRVDWVYEFRIFSPQI